MRAAQRTDGKYAVLMEAVGKYGLALRGGFHSGDTDLVPEGTRTLILIGNVGSHFWPPADLRPDEPDPLNSWTKRTLDPIATGLGAIALYPFGDPPHHPFQRWAKKASDVRSSPLGILIDPVHGLWHAYRAAFAFSEEIALPPAENRPDPCGVCTDRPCLSTCPVTAFRADSGYDVDTCRHHLRSGAGEDCMTQACRARRACPVGIEFTYDTAFSSFLMSVMANTGD